MSFLWNVRDGARAREPDQKGGGGLKVRKGFFPDTRGPGRGVAGERPQRGQDSPLVGQPTGSLPWAIWRVRIESSRCPRPSRFHVAYISPRPQPSPPSPQGSPLSPLLPLPRPRSRLPMAAVSGPSTARHPSPFKRQNKISARPSGSSSHAVVVSFSSPPIPTCLSWTLNRPSLQRTSTTAMKRPRSSARGSSRICLRVRTSRPSPPPFLPPPPRRWRTSSPTPSTERGCTRP